MKRARINLGDIPDFVIYILLFLACINYKQMGSLIFLLFNICVFCKNGLKIKFDKIAWLYLGLMIAISISGMWFYSINEIIKATNYVCCYISGYNLYLIHKNKSVFLKKIFMSIFAGYFGYILLLLYKNYNIETYQRVLVDIWSGKYIAVTLVAVITSISMGVAIYFVLFEKKWHLKAIGGGIILIDAIINFKTATRTPFVLFPIVLIFSFVIKYRSETQKKKIRILGYGILFFVLCIAIISFDLFSFRTMFMDSLVGRRFIENDSMSRVGIFVQHMKYSFEFPWGGRRISDKVYKAAHNILQDFYDVYGVFAGMTCLFIIFSQVQTLVILAKSRNNKYEKLMAILLFVMLVQVWTEPIVTGYPIYVWTLFLLSGIARAYLADNNMYRRKYESYTNKYM